MRATYLAIISMKKKKKKEKKRAVAFRTKQIPTGEELGDKIFGCLNGIFHSGEF